VSSHADVVIVLDVHMQMSLLF